MREQELIQQLHENFRNTEIERYKYYPTRLLIYGRPGTGQSAIAEELSKRSKIKLYRAGGIKREELRQVTGAEIIGYHHFEKEEDSQIDTEIAREILQATKDEKVIIDAKLSNVIFREIAKKIAKNKGEKLEGIGILIVAKAEVRFKRIRQREIKKYMEKTGVSFEEAQKRPEFSPRSIHLKTLEREQGDLNRWRINHPQLRGIDPFNTANKDNQGHKIFDFHINTTDLSVTQGADLIEAILLTKYKTMEKKKAEA